MCERGSTKPVSACTKSNEFVRGLNSDYLTTIWGNAIGSVLIENKVIRTLDAIVHALIRTCLTSGIAFGAVSFCPSLQSNVTSVASN